MPKLADGMVDIQSLFMLLAVQVVAAIMDAEVDRLCGDGANNRNGNRGRLVTCVDMLNLRVPQLWTGGFFPEDVLERHRCVDLALIAAVAEMCTTSSRPRGRGRLRTAGSRTRRRARGRGPARYA